MTVTLISRDFYSERGKSNIFIHLFFDFQTYVNLEVYDDKDYVNFDVVT